MLHQSPRRLLRAVLRWAAVTAALVAGPFLCRDAAAQRVTWRFPDGNEAALYFDTGDGVDRCEGEFSISEASRIDCPGYAIHLQARKENSGWKLQFRILSTGDRPVPLNSYELKARVKYLEGNAVWSPNQVPRRGLRHAIIDAPFRTDTAPNLGIPFALLATGAGNNRLAVGLLKQDRLAELRGSANAEKSEYLFTLRQTQRFERPEIEDGFYVSWTSQNWFRAAQAYTRSVDAYLNYQPLRIPAQALEPTYDSWYWTEDRIHEGLVRELARLAADLGFRNYLFDAGWEAAPGEYFKWLAGGTGDYLPPRKSFPDFEGLLRELRQDMGLSVMLWTQHYAMGQNSSQYARFGHALAQEAHPETGELRETAALCPRTPATRDYMQELFARLTGDYRPEAFWFDWQEEIPVDCRASHDHEPGTFGESYNRLQRGIVDAILRANPEAFIEMRWPYANLNNKPYAHLWQPTDAPGDHETMRLQAMNLRAFSRGVAVASDEMYWDPEESYYGVAAFMASVVFSGVPNFGPNLLMEDDERREMLAAWLRFYKQHRNELLNGDFLPYGSFNRPDQKIEGSSESFIYYRSRYTGTLTLSKRNSRLFLVNASMKHGIDLRMAGLKPGRYEAVISNIVLRDGQPRALQVPASGAFRLQLDVPIGCLLSLYWISG